MKMGIVGLPNVGKSTLFNAITKAGAQAANYPFCTIEPNIGIVNVPDSRLDALAEIYHPEKYTPATFEFVDIAGLVKGASRGEGLGNQFLSHIREVDAIVHVIRCFEDMNVVHVDGSVDPGRDAQTINYELIFADIDTLDKRMAKTAKLLRVDKSAAHEMEVMEQIKLNLEKGLPARMISFESEDEAFVRSLFLLTTKPVIYAANIAEEGIGQPNQFVEALTKIAKEEGAGLLKISAQVEEEISTLDPNERLDFLQDLGLEESGLDRLIKAGYALLGLISFLTAGPQEVRAWTIQAGTKAPQAAGKIHSDFERGFIRAEVVSFENLIDCGSIASAKEKGLVRSEGKDYIVQDGDVILFRFNV